MSEHLSTCSVPHLVVERHRIAERWRSEKWDSLVANGPAWHDRFPGMEFPDTHADAFVHKEKVADYFVAYASQISAPVRCGVEVKAVHRDVGRRGFRIRTSDRVIEANNVVAATGAFQRPMTPALVPGSAGLMQIHSNSYKNPDRCRRVQYWWLAQDPLGCRSGKLSLSGKRVYLSVGPHDRPPRSYRQRDYCWWLGVLGKWDAQAKKPGTEHVTIAVSGASGGHTIDFRRLATQGITLLGRTELYSDGVVFLRADLAENLARGDANFLSVLDEADAYVVRNGINLPQEPDAHKIAPESEMCNASHS